MKHHLCMFAALIILVACPLWIGCGGSPADTDGVGNTNFEATEPFYFGVGLDAHFRLRLVGVSGNITVTGLTVVDSVIVAGEKRVRSESTEDAEEHLQYLTVDVQDLTDEVAVKTEQPDVAQGRQYEVDYEITLPRDFMVHITNVNGNVTIESITSSVSVTNTNGWVELEGISGNTSIILTNGVIAGDLTLPLDGLISMNCANGSINIEIPTDTSAGFSASVTNGSITVSNLVINDMQSTPTSLSGTLGGGRGTIQLTVINGNISVAGS